MRRAQEYRKNAAQTLRLARHAPTSAGKAHLLDLAERWLELANRIAKTSQAASARRPALGNEFSQRPHS
jgi:hypothetical protein